MIEAYSVLDMFGPIYGGNWHPPELRGSASFRWSGPGQHSWLFLPSLGAVHLRATMRLARPPHPEHLSRIQMQVDGMPQRVLWSQSGAETAIWVEVRRTDAEAPSIRLDLNTPISAEPSSPHRQVGLAVNRVEVLALSSRPQADCG